MHVIVILGGQCPMLFSPFPFCWSPSSFPDPISGRNQLPTLTERGETTGNKVEDETEVMVLQKML